MAVSAFEPRIRHVRPLPEEVSHTALAPDVTRWWVVPTNQIGSGQRERKTAYLGVLWIGRVTSTAAREGRRMSLKPLWRCGITTRPAGVIQRAMFDQRAFRKDTLTGASVSGSETISIRSC